MIGILNSRRMANNTRDQYLMESQQRYLKFIQQYSEPEINLQPKVLHEQHEREKERKKVSRKAKYMEQPSLTMDRYVPSKFRVYNIVLDSHLRDFSQFPYTNDFVVRLVEPLRNVVAIRMLRTEFAPTSNPNNTNLYSNAYLYLNGYTSMYIANDTSTTFFGRIAVGNEMYPAITSDPTLDPYILMLQPVEQKLRRFHVSLMNADRSPYVTGSDASLVITLAIYCLQ